MGVPVPRMVVTRPGAGLSDVLEGQMRAGGTAFLVLDVAWRSLYFAIKSSSYIDKMHRMCDSCDRSCSSNADHWKDGGATNGEPVWSKNHRKRRTQWRWGWELTAYRTLEWRQCPCREVCAVAREKNAPRTVRIVRSPK